MKFSEWDLGEFTQKASIIIASNTANKGYQTAFIKIYTFVHYITLIIKYTYILKAREYIKRIE